MCEWYSELNDYGIISFSRESSPITNEMQLNLWKYQPVDDDVELEE